MIGYPSGYLINVTHGATCTIFSKEQVIENQMGPYRLFELNHGPGYLFLAVSGLVVLIYVVDGHLSSPYILDEMRKDPQNIVEGDNMEDLV